MNIIIIFGGKNDNNNRFASKSGILNDLSILNVENLNWIKVEVNGLSNIQKCGFSCC